MGRRKLPGFGELQGSDVVAQLRLRRCPMLESAASHNGIRSRCNVEGDTQA